jgi:hypothetical protein
LLEHVDAAMELAHPAGAESLAPQPSQLASAVASTKKSLLANLRNLDGRAQPSPNGISVARKDQKSAQEHALPAQVIGRVDGELSDRTTMPPPHTTGLVRRGECVHFVANAKHR